LPPTERREWVIKGITSREQVNPMQDVNDETLKEVPKTKGSMQLLEIPKKKIGSQMTT